MKKISANSPEGKELLKKYGNKIMQDGGKINPADVLVGSVVTGVDPNTQTVNAEVETDEFIKTPNGQVAEVQGKTHKQGGEKMNLPQGTKVLSDNIKIGKEIKKILEDEFGINVKASTTFAQAHDKIKNKLGITEVEEEQSKYISILAKNKEVEDEATAKTNEDFLGKKISQIEQVLKLKKDQENSVYEMLFAAQEGRKGTEDREDIQVEETIQQENTQMVQDGGVIKYQDGNPQQTTTPISNNNVTSSELDSYFELPAGKFTWESLTGTEKSGLDENIKTWVTNFRNTYGDDWVNQLNNVSIAGGSSTSPVSLKTRKTLETELINEYGKKPLDKYSNDEANYVLAKKRATVLQDYFKKYLSENYKDVNIDNVKLSDPTINDSQGEPYDPKKGIQSEDYKKFQNVGITLTTQAEKPKAQSQPVPPVNEVAKPAEGFVPPSADVLGGPLVMQTPYRGMPNPLMTTQLNLPYADVVTPIKVSPEEALRENNRAFNAATDVLNTAPGANVGATLANLLGNTQNVNNQAISEANRTNAQLAQQAQFQNQQVGANLSAARTQAMDIYGKENLMALDNTLNDIRSWQQVLSTDQINAQREGRQLKMLDALAPNYTFDMFGNVVYTPTNEQYYFPKNAAQSKIMYGQPKQDNSFTQAQLDAISNYMKTQNPTI